MKCQLAVSDDVIQRLTQALSEREVRIDAAGMQYARWSLRTQPNKAAAARSESLVRDNQQMQERSVDIAFGEVQDERDGAVSEGAGYPRRERTRGLPIVLEEAERDHR